MLIQDVPCIFQPKCNLRYPNYSYGKNMEEIFFELLIDNNEKIRTDYIYLPIFWTSFYVSRNYGENISDLYHYLESLDKSKKYITIVQYASGIFVKNFDLNLLVFSSGGGGLNIKEYSTIHNINFNGLTRSMFFGNIANFILPLICKPTFPFLNLNKDIFCSFMGRFDTHPCRFKMKNLLETNNKIKIFKSTNFENYKNILNKSIFSLAPRGYGYTSFRIYEALLAESIPIYIWEDKKVLPFQDKINWQEIAIIIHSDDISKLPEILDTFNKEKINKFIENIRKVKYMFSFDYSFKYLCEKIN